VSEAPAEEGNMATLHEYFISDFARLMNIFAEHKALNTKTGVEVPIAVRVHLEFDAGVRFISIFVPAGISPIDVANHYINNPQDALKAGESLVVSSGIGGSSNFINSQDLSFSGRIFLYCEEEPDTIARSATEALARSKGIKLAIRSIDYRDARAVHEKPLAFISHDSRDKIEIAEPIALGLIKLSCPVWYDEYTLKVGDSLRQSIEKGIKECRACVLILSPSFLSNEGWTKAEFDSVYTREIVEKSNLILPVWHKVGAREIYEYSPRLADKRGINTEKGVEEVVRQVKAAIDSHNR
jgi:hypothetical protein